MVYDKGHLAKTYIFDQSGTFIQSPFQYVRTFSSHEMVGSYFHLWRLTQIEVMRLGIETWYRVCIYVISVCTVKQEFTVLNTMEMCL